MQDQDRKAVEHLKEAIGSGKHWYLALLEAIGLWSSTEEETDGVRSRYLIDNEAFDWLVLAERLSREVKGSIPENELVNLLFLDKPPLEVDTERFRQLIGEAKYKGYLNYLYGVLTEGALHQATVEEIRKERRNLGMSNDASIDEEVYQRIYGSSEEVLRRQFREEKGLPHAPETDLEEMAAFNYWLFKHRLAHCEKARMASDTKKALAYLHRQWQAKRRLLERTGSVT
ncbi:MAG: hypothetical protein V1737_01040 [Chloroflexota bacterium]